MYFRYDIVPHSLLTHSAVKECLFYLVQKIHTALQEFHGLGFAHYDVRLPNIIDDNYNAVLIDLDRCKMCRKDCFLLLLNSCMYNKKLGPQEHDWLQLGWLAGPAQMVSTTTTTMKENLTTLIRNTRMTPSWLTSSKQVSWVAFLVLFIV